VRGGRGREADRRGRKERTEGRGGDGPLTQIPGSAPAAPRLYDTLFVNSCVRPFQLSGVTFGLNSKVSQMSNRPNVRCQPIKVKVKVDDATVRC